jgi:hypothetical protein
MLVRTPANFGRACLFALAIAATAMAGQASAQNPAAQTQGQPSAAAIALAKEIIAAKSSTGGFESVGPSVIERVKAVFLQTSPNLAKDLNEVAAKLRADYAARFSEPTNAAARLYASRFSEQELKDILAFYRSPVGKKVVVQEPLVIEESMQTLDQWASTLSEEIMAKMRAEMRKKGHDL